MYGYIYKTTDLSNGKIYIGQHTSTKFLAERYVGSGNIIQKIVQKCKKDNIPITDRLKTELLEECNSIQELNEKEMYWISFYGSHNINIGYNLNDGGGGGNHNLGKTWSDEVNKSKGRSRELNPMYGKHHSIETKEKISLANKGRTQTVESNLKRSNSLKGRIRSEEASRKCSESLKGKKKSEEHKKKLSASRTGKIFITNGIDTKCIIPEDINKYDSTWYRGRTFNFKPWNKGLTKYNCDKLQEIGIKSHNTRQAKRQNS